MTLKRQLKHDVKGRARDVFLVDARVVLEQEEGRANIYIAESLCQSLLQRSTNGWIAEVVAGLPPVPGHHGRHFLDED